MEPSGARAPWIDLPEVQSTRSRIWCSETLLGSGSEVLPDTESGDNRPKLRPQCDQATRDRWGQMPDSGRRHGRWPGPTGTRGDGKDGRGRVMADYGSAAGRRALAVPCGCTRLWGDGDMASGLHSGSALVVDLELVHTQPLHLKLLDLEPPDNRTPD